MKLRKLLGDFAVSLPVFLFLNLLLFWAFAPVLSVFQKIMLTALLALCYLGSGMIPFFNQWGSIKVSVLSHGLAQLRQGMICMFAEPVLYLFLLLHIPLDNRENLIWLLANFAFYALFILLLFLAGMIRVGAAGRQVKWYWYAFMLFWWMIPGLNILILLKIYHTAKVEMLFETARLELDEVRREDEICKTRYPILLVHGIFFRDWQFFNYWGRIPAALRKNGAEVYYGSQQSSQSISASAAELNKRIHEILEETGAEKVNIIAHSKGGLDTRYAIAELGAGPYIASLTMINTPHHGCAWVDDLLRKLPRRLVEWVAKRYNAVFRKLGDREPDFLGGVMDLTAESCKTFNEKYPIDKSIPHHCIMSNMRAFFSAHFMFGVSFLCNKFYDPSGLTDGLVPVESSKLEGVPFTLVPNKHFRGISHGDMIDLTRENIRGFDVREFYVGIVKDLKEKGL